MPVILSLILAVIAETIGTMALQASAQFTRLGPSVLAAVGYGVAFYFLSLTLRTMPVGVVYALWSGFGILLIALFGFLVFGQKLDLAAVLGMAMIIGGIAVIQVFSRTNLH
ncbi:DMT family transporter [Pseudooceanicola algae]|uniref:Multidrug transporter EmrE n=1 Tax=Pseudooceanicola algae TaxID=1537215 RepID=A0A418SE15_9RHOB|nr:multidrug efflux SMR transporter [Pseudooceanicola algae]QPM89560.1 Multidrug transporter EmrE [Pseudooceanicola algae]